MEIVRNQSYDNRRLPIDGHRFEDCTFSQTKLIYYGQGPVEFSGCVFDACTWVFEGAAFETLQFLCTLSDRLGDDGGKLVAAIFGSVTEGTLGEKLMAVPDVASAA